jgi:hypothetical protein
MKKSYLLGLALMITVSLVRASDPLLVDAIGTSTNSGVDAGNRFVVYLPQPALGGNLIACGITYRYSASRTLTIGDNEGSNTWNVATKANGGTTLTYAIVYAAGVAAGTQKITFTFDAALTSFQAACKEAYGVDTISPVDVTSSASNVSAPTIASGSMTTTSAGDLVFQYGNNYSAGNDLPSLQQFVTTLTAGSGWSPIIADVQTGQFFQDIQQQSAGIITPSYTVSGSATYSTVAVAFKTNGSAGTAPPLTGIHIDHQYTIVLLGGQSATVEFPSDGNFLTVTETDTSNSVAVSGSTNTFIKNEVAAPGNEAITWYATAAATSPTLTISLTNSGDGNTEFVMRDVRGVATSSPLDTTAGAEGIQSSFSAGTTITQPSLITPAASGELLILAMQNGCGPTQYVSSPSGAGNDSIWFTGQIDADPFDEGEGHAHFVTTGTSAISVTWVMQNTQCGANAWGVGAWLFKAIAGDPPVPPTGLSAAVN